MQRGRTLRHQRGLRPRSCLFDGRCFSCTNGARDGDETDIAVEVDAHNDARLASSALQIATAEAACAKRRMFV